VKQSQHRLEQLGYFTPDSVKAEPVADPANLPSDAKNLEITVEEQSTGNVTFGAGYNTVESVSGFVQVEEDNFDLGKPPYFIGQGGGQKVLVNVQIGTLLQNYRLKFTEPWFMGRHLRLDTDFYHTVSDFQSLDNLYDIEHTGMSVGLTRALGRESILGSVSYSIDQVDVTHINTNSPDAILSQGGHKLLNRLGAGISYDTRNDVQLPNSGTLTSFNTVLTLADQSYVKMDLGTAWYFKGLAKGHVLEVLGKAGVAQKLGSEDVPFYDRYYLGGQYDLRGYDYTAVGPRAATQDGQTFEPIGGDTYWLGSVEYSLPIIDRLRFAVFYDIGNVSAKPFNNGGFDVYGKSNEGLVNSLPQPFSGPTFEGNTGTYSDNYGVGLRLNIPHLGPLRLDYGIPRHHDPFSGNTGKFQFSAGFTRPI